MGIPRSSQKVTKVTRAMKLFLWIPQASIWALTAPSHMAGLQKAFKLTAFNDACRTDPMST